MLLVSPLPDIAQTADSVPFHSSPVLLPLGPNQARSHRGGTMPNTTTSNAITGGHWSGDFLGMGQAGLRGV